VIAMLRIGNKELDAPSAAVLSALQSQVDVAADYPSQVLAAKLAWDNKTGTKARSAAFISIRTTLGTMCIGSVRCAYCEDSAADEVEHILPKNLFPEQSFRWSNYLFACGPCNGPKSNRYGTVDGEEVKEFIRGKNDPVVRPPAGQSGFIDPRTEDPFDFLEMDLGGTTPQGVVLAGTFQLLPREGLSGANHARAKFTIDVLGLNREVIRVARENAFGGFRARMVEYVQKKEAGAGADDLDKLRHGILTTPHLSVFEEMRHQRVLLPEVADLILRAPEMLGWAILPD
jgi:hypothetical protein